MLYILQLHKQLRESEQQVQRLTVISSDQKQTVARLEAQLDNLLEGRLLGFEARLQQLEAQRQSDSRRLEQKLAELSALRIELAGAAAARGLRGE